MTLTSQQKQILKGRAHALKPVVLTGNQGLTAAVLQEIDKALTAHELIKVRLNAEQREDRQAMIQTICETTQAELIQTIGHIAVFYRAKTS